MVTHEHAVEVDTKLADLWGQRQQALNGRDALVDRLHWMLREQPVRRGRGAGRWPTTTEEATVKVAAIAADLTRMPHVTREAADLLARLTVARAQIVELEAQAAPFEEEFRAERWPRFFLVNNTGGHVHSSMHCATTFPTTSWSWLPQLSGLTEDAAVASQGPRLCSVCFPGAPVEWTLGLPAKVDPDRCPGSGQQGVDINWRYQTPRGRCPVCNSGSAVSSTGKVRPHKTPKV